MIKAMQTARVLSRIKRRDGAGGRGAEITQRTIDGSQNALHVAVGEHGGNQAGDFPVPEILIPVDKLDGVTREMFFPWKVIKERVQMVLEGGHRVIISA